MKRCGGDDFYAQIPPTPHRWKVIFNGGKSEMRFMHEEAARQFAAANKGTVTPYQPADFKLQRAR